MTEMFLPCLLFCFVGTWLCGDIAGTDKHVLGFTAIPDVDENTDLSLPQCQGLLVNCCCCQK